MWQQAAGKVAGVTVQPILPIDLFVLKAVKGIRVCYIRLGLNGRDLLPA
jgi:hypothetical protein